MKKLYIIIVIIVILSCTNCYALSKSDLTALYLDSLKTYDKPQNYTSVQGGTTTDKYIITLYINEDEGSDKKTAISVIDKNTFEEVHLEENPIKRYDFKHSNDATYNSKTNELVILSGRKVHFLDLNDDKFELVREVDLDKYYHGLGYDEDTESYVLARTINKGTLFEIRDNDFNIKSKFKLKTNLTKQSLTVYQGNIYYVCYESGRVNKYEKVYDGLLKRKENLIYVYSLKGKKKNIFYIPYDYRELIFGEIENISFNNGKMLIQFNHANKAGYFTAEYRHDINSIITLDVVEEDSSDYEYILYSGKNEIARAKSYDNKITYYLQYVDEGKYKYHIKRKVLNNKKNNKKKSEELRIISERYIDKEMELELEIYYDPVDNMLKTKTNSSDLVLLKDKFYSEVDFRKFEEENKKE